MTDRKGWWSRLRDQLGFERASRSEREADDGVAWLAVVGEVEDGAGAEVEGCDDVDGGDGGGEE